MEKEIKKGTSSAKDIPSGSKQTFKRSSKNKQKNQRSQRSNSTKSGGEGIPNRNDWSFYAFNEQVARDVANIPFNYVPGTKLAPLSEETNYTFASNVPFTEHMPGLLCLDYIPGPGSSFETSSGVNMAARQMYSFIRRANSGARNYEAPDLMMYLLAMENVYLKYFEIRRAYSLCRSYYYMNRFMPELLVQACRINFTGAQSQLAQFRYKLNVVREKINSMAVPKGFKSFERRAYVASQVFTDSDTLRSQFYMLRAKGYYKFNPTKYESGGCLEFVDTSSNDVPFNTALSQLDSMIDAIITDDDMNTMSGDIIKAFGEQGLYTVADVPEELVLQPVYDEDICGQIENARALRVFPTSNAEGYNTLDIWQKNNTIYWTPRRISFANSPTVLGVVGDLDSATTILFNSHKTNPTPQDIIEWTRLMTVSDDTQEDEDAISCGLELVTNFTLIGFTSDGDLESLDFNNSWVVGSTDPAGGHFRYFIIQACLAQFDWHPSFRMMRATINLLNANPLTDLAISQPGLDLKVFTPLDRSVIRNMHGVANYSVYHTNLY